ncbi:alpha/beta hydrolase [Lacisediminihabitans profunda]|uniref:Alpha/beta hydrolase n=2 Tax=Lacisediminihabitans profunda TaxID=2594790 RepID=A0A5C8USV0_9MICO|nr:alpha/beta hydrolase [Lacisediminihabitans profunda]
MARLGPSERVRLNVDPITTVDYVSDVDFVGDGIREHRLDVISPKESHGPLPVYVYFHGGGWTSGDKSALTKYCASQAMAGMVVVNVNYRMATSFRMSHMLEDADAALAWVSANIREFGGDPSRVVLGGDSAGGQIAALYSSLVVDHRLSGHYSLEPSLDRSSLRGLVQHCSAVDFSVIFERGFILSLGFIRMLLPHGGRGSALRSAARYLSPIEWVGAGHPPVFVTTSERDYFYRANLNYVARLRKHGVPVDTVIFERASRNTEHTWQQDARFPESQEVYRRLQEFVGRVASPAKVVAH